MPVAREYGCLIGDKRSRDHAKLRVSHLIDPEGVLRQIAMNVPLTWCGAARWVQRMVTEKYIRQFGKKAQGHSPVIRLRN
jgi:alkyl hydroperoxide reductase subunit AhpC